MHSQQPAAANKAASWPLFTQVNDTPIRIMPDSSIIISFFQ